MCESSNYWLLWCTGTVRESGLRAEGKVLSKPLQIGDEGCYRGTRRKERKILGDVLWCVPLTHQTEICCPLIFSVLCSPSCSFHSWMYFKQAKPNGTALILSRCSALKLSLSYAKQKSQQKKKKEKKKTVEQESKNINKVLLASAPCTQTARTFVHHAAMASKSGAYPTSLLHR